MPLTKEQGQMLTTLALACRPVGAPRWDAAGVMAAIGKVAHLALADVILAVTRAASDRTAETPGVIAATNSTHWRERVGESVRPSPPKLAEACPSHPAYPATNCGGCAADRLAGDPPPNPARRVTDPTPYTTAIRKQFGWTSKEASDG